MITKKMLEEFALLKQVESMKELRMLYEVLKPTNPFEKWYEELALEALKKIKEEINEMNRGSYFKEEKK